MSIKVFSPFIELMLWALILSVTLYPFFKRIEHRFNGRHGLSSTILILFIIIILGIPSFIIGDSLISFLQDSHNAFQEKNIQIAPPSPEVSQWPLIGKKTFEIWNEAANNPPVLLVNNVVGNPLRGDPSKIMFRVTFASGCILLPVIMTVSLLAYTSYSVTTE